MIHKNVRIFYGEDEWHPISSLSDRKKAVVIGLINYMFSVDSNGIVSDDIDKIFNIKVTKIEDGNIRIESSVGTDSEGSVEVNWSELK